MTISGISNSGSSQAASQIASINQQIQSITKQLKELSNNDYLTIEQKAEQQQLLESQIQILQAQLAQLQQKQAEKAQQTQPISQSSETKADGVNRPTDENQLNVYI